MQLMNSTYCICSLQKGCYIMYFGYLALYNNDNNNVHCNIIVNLYSKLHCMKKVLRLDSLTISLFKLNKFVKTISTVKLIKWSFLKTHT